MRGLEQIPLVYDSLMSVMDRLLLGRWRRTLIQKGDGTVLEVGVGTGRTLALHPPSARVVGLDPDRIVLRTAQRRAPGVPLVQARVEALPFREDTFDVVVSSLVFCSVGDPEAGLLEVARVLQPGGCLRMLEHVRPRSRFGAWLARFLQPPWTALTGGCRPDRDTEGTVRRMGFRVDPHTRRSRWILRRLDAVPEGDDGR
jgi:ubiquinone/menaquinone biosynthesis C-methylase UbiE